ncbi:zeta toxin family protein [Microbacterium luticocti]|uniref:zeta toxin family protein n=1 Tax=Microbacterium luticocti TaxID=451764 RepID=UPI0004293F36|nr:zeta toxin family protein [Microbacterium luticocti]
MPVLHLLAGPDGSGKSTYVERILQPVTHLPFVNASIIAAERWSDSAAEHAYEASRVATAECSRLMAAGVSFITETVFSHPSKVEFVEDALAHDYLVQLHVMLVPVELSVTRVADRIAHGGHAVPEQKIRERHARLWDLVARARALADRTEFFENSAASTPFRRVAVYEHGMPVGTASWPAWAPAVLIRRP